VHIEFAKRSSFIEPCERGIRAEIDALQSGRSVSFPLGPGGYDAAIRVFISSTNRDAFETNWSSPDPTRFPARIRAAATALRNCGFTGPIEIAHRNGELFVQMILAPPPINSSSPLAVSADRDPSPPSSGRQESRRPEQVRHPPGSAPHEVVFVSCVSAKRSVASQAKELYTSSWFLKARRYVEALGRPWFILSAEHGLLAPETIVAPYEKTLNTMPIDQRRAWASRVLRQMDDSLPAISVAVFLAGERYREFLLPHLSTKHVQCMVPMAGLRIGEQLGWLDAQARKQAL